MKIKSNLKAGVDDKRVDVDEDGFMQEPWGVVAKVVFVKK